MVVTFGFLGTAFYFTYRPRRASAGADCCSPALAAPPAGGIDCCSDITEAGDPATTPIWRRLNMMTANKVMLWAVTALAIAFLFFPQYVTRLIATGDQEITTQMTRTELRIEGMTCDG
jgi:hypothetical protein